MSWSRVSLDGKLSLSEPANCSQNDGTILSTAAMFQLHQVDHVALSVRDPATQTCKRSSCQLRDQHRGLNTPVGIIG